MARESRSFAPVLLLGLGGAVAAGAGTAVWLHARAPLVGQAATALLVGGGAAAAIGAVVALWRSRLDARDLVGFALAAALVAAAATYFWDDWHEPVWIDNGTAGIVTVHFRGARVTEVAAGDQRAVVLPRVAGPLEVAAPDGAVLDRLERIELPGREPRSTLVLNVAGAHCYRLETGEYQLGGGIGFLAGPPQPAGGRFFAVDADYLFEPLPQEIRVPQPDPRAGRLPTLRRALVVVPCRGTGGPGSR